jgi:hypothetical protein
METKTQRDFASFLNDPAIGKSVPEDEPAVEDIGPAPTIPFDYLSVAEELHSGRIQLQPDRRKGGRRDAADPYRAELEAYLEAASPLIESPPLSDEFLPSIKPADVASELGLESADASDFKQIRRDFAFANHPDRVAPHLRERAMVRMQLANMLIDDAQRRAGTSVKR